jgi:pilus assembly protein Flp/PilA
MELRLGWANTVSRQIMLIQVRRFLKDESGVAAVEYGLIVSGISVAIIPAVKAVGQKLVTVFTILQNAL